jgi:DNA repair protein RecN (Recombination protein N)
VQRDILDALAGALPERREMAQAFEVARQLGEEEHALEAKRNDVRMRADYLQHVVREIEDVTPLPGEDEQLAQEARRLSHAEELTRLAEELVELLDGDAQNSGSSALGEAARTLSAVERIDSSVARWRELLDAAATGIVELARDVREYASEIEVDPSRLAAVESRRDRLYRLLQKYGDSVAAVMATGQKALEELDVLDSADFDLARIAERRTGAEAEMLLPALGLPQGRLVPKVSPLESPGPTGGDSIEFLVQLNPGMDPRPLAQVASGGELSRIMLALKVVLSDHDAVQTLVFDEVDQGIGGETGAQIGMALAEVGARRQVLVITHLPQIAARATHHLRVTKGVERGMAATRVQELLGEDRVAEVARMLGDGSDDALKRHAVALLQKTSPPAGVLSPRPGSRVAGAH